MYLCVGWHTAWQSVSSLLREFPTIFIAGPKGYVACEAIIHYANYAFEFTTILLAICFLQYECCTYLVKGTILCYAGIFDCETLFYIGAPPI